MNSCEGVKRFTEPLSSKAEIVKESVGTTAIIAKTNHTCITQCRYNRPRPVNLDIVENEEEKKKEEKINPQILDMKISSQRSYVRHQEFWETAI